VEVELVVMVQLAEMVVLMVAVEEVDLDILMDL
jgi:hypothetical protein